MEPSMADILTQCQELQERQIQALSALDQIEKRLAMEDPRIHTIQALHQEAMKEITATGNSSFIPRLIELFTPRKIEANPE